MKRIHKQIRVKSLVLNSYKKEKLKLKNKKPQNSEREKMVEKILEIKEDNIDEEFLKDIMKKDKIFPDIDYMLYY